MMNLDLDNWVFLTGDQESVNEILKVAGMEAIKETVDTGSKVDQSYSMSHRDRISLVDKNGTIRKHYKGSEFSPDELLVDIKGLL